MNNFEKTYRKKNQNILDLYEIETYVKPKRSLTNEELQGIALTILVVLVTILIIFG
jgi:hypothetical protein